MTKFGDLINAQSLVLLNQIVETEETERYNRKKELYERRGFRSYEEMLEYIKTNGYVGDAGSSYSWKPIDEDKEHPIVHRYQTSDGNDCVFWYESKRISEEEFLSYYNGLIEKYGKEHLFNEFGCLCSWMKNADVVG